jgi:hypothetical protein
LGRKRDEGGFMALKKGDIEQAVFGLDDITTEEVPVPEWKTSVFVRSMTLDERDAWEASITETKNGEVKQNLKDFYSKLVIRTAVDEQGNLLFAETDIPRLQKKSAKAMNRIFKVAQQLNGIGQEAVDKLEKN